MKRDEVLALLRAHRERLHAEYGVKSLALFGSVARDEAQPESDVDVLAERRKRFEVTPNRREGFGVGERLLKIHSIVSGRHGF